MKNTLYILCGLVALLLTSCGGEKKPVEEDEIITTRREVKVDNSIHSLNPLDLTDTVSFNGRHYQYRIQRQTADSTHVVVGEDELRYLDNTIGLSVSRDGSQLFQHQFTKQEFTSQLQKAYRKHGILLNLVFDKATRQGLIFKLYIGGEDSETQAIFKIYVADNGTFRFEQGDVFDEEDINRIQDPEAEREE